MLIIAEKKCVFDFERLEMRLRSFPVELLDDLTVKDERLARRLQTDYHSIIELLPRE